MKFKSLFFAALISGLFFASCSDDDDNSGSKNFDAKLDTVSVGVNQAELTWVEPENVAYYEIKVLQGTEVISEETPILKPNHILTDLEEKTTYTAEIYGQYSDMTEDKDPIGTVTFTTKEDLGPQYGSVVELSALFPGDGDKMVYMAGSYGISFAAASPVDVWNSIDYEAELTFYMGGSESSLSKHGDSEDWTAKIGNSNSINLGNMMAAGTYYWKVSIEFTIDGETFTQESAVHNFIKE